MAGGVSPYEWIMPAVALTHIGYNASAQQVAPGLKLDTPGSANQRSDSAAGVQRNQADAMRGDAERKAADYLAANPLAQTPDEELQARRRAQAAGALMLGGKRPSQYLAGGGSLGATV